MNEKLQDLIDAQIDEMKEIEDVEQYVESINEYIWNNTKVIELEEKEEKEEKENDKKCVTKSDKCRSIYQNYKKSCSAYTKCKNIDIDDMTPEQILEYTTDYLNKYNAYKNCHYGRLEHKMTCINKDCWNDSGHEYQIDATGEIYMFCKRVLSKMLSYLSGLRINDKIKELTTQKLKILAIASGGSEVQVKIALLSQEIVETTSLERKYAAEKKRFGSEIYEISGSIEHTKGKARGELIAKKRELGKLYGESEKKTREMVNKRNELAKMRKELLAESSKTVGENKEIVEIDREIGELQSLEKKIITTVSKIQESFSIDEISGIDQYKEEKLKKMDIIRKINDKLYRIKKYAPSGDRFDTKTESRIVKDLYGIDSIFDKTKGGGAIFDRYILPKYGEIKRDVYISSGYDFLLPYLLSVYRNRFTLAQFEVMLREMEIRTNVWGNE